MVKKVAIADYLSVNLVDRVFDQPELDSGAEVVVALTDPNPEVNGDGLKALAEAGIRCRAGLLQAEAENLNSGFISRMTRGIPFVRLKIAASLDGCTAMSSGESQWITGADARADVQRLRARSGAIGPSRHWAKSAR